MTSRKPSHSATARPRGGTLGGFGDGHGSLVALEV